MYNCKKIIKDISAFFTCGIGDYIAIDSFLRKEERESITKIYWGTRQRKNLMRLAVNSFPNLKAQTIVHDDFTGPNTNMFCFNSIEDMGRKTGKIIYDKNIIDYSISVVFLEIIKRRRIIYYSPLFKNILADISKFNLPEKFILVHPYSDNLPDKQRDFSNSDWKYIINMAVSCNLPCVVVGQGDRSIPSSERIINLINKTTVLEVLEITKKAYSFIGSASFVSVFASKLICPNKILVKSVQSLIDGYWWKCYYAPINDVNILHSKFNETIIKKLEKVLCDEILDLSTISR